MTLVVMLLDFILKTGYGSTTPVCVAVGKGYKCAPVKVELRLMTPDQRAGWWDRHVDDSGSAAFVFVISETTRTEE